MILNETLFTQKFKKKNNTITSIIYVQSSLLKNILIIQVNKWPSNMEVKEILTKGNEFKGYSFNILCIFTKPSYRFT